MARSDDTSFRGNMRTMAQTEPQPHPKHLIEADIPTEEETCPVTPWWRNWKVMVPVWLAIGVLVWLGIHFNVDRRVIAGSVVVIGILSNAFAWLVGIIALVPIIGPLIIKVLSIGFIWLLNAIGYLVALVAIRRGYSKDVLTYRGLTIALIIGIVIGYVIGKII
jgi:hypothetical protein